MPSKTTTSYETVFRHLKALGLSPQNVMLDFEVSACHVELRLDITIQSAALNAVKKVWQDARLLGCWWHWLHCQFGAYERCHVTRTFNTLPVSRRFIRLIAALPWAPADDIPRIFQLIERSAIDTCGAVRPLHYENTIS